MDSTVPRQKYSQMAKTHLNGWFWTLHRIVRPFSGGLFFSIHNVCGSLCFGSVPCYTCYGAMKWVVGVYYAILMQFWENTKSLIHCAIACAIGDWATRIDICWGTSPWRAFVVFGLARPQKFKKCERTLQRFKTHWFFVFFCELRILLMKNCISSHPRQFLQFAV